MNQITIDLTNRLKRFINGSLDTRIYSASEVSFFEDKHIRVDYMMFKPLNNSVSGIEKGDFYCYEVKSSPKDFYSGHGLNFIGDFNYLVMTRDTFEIVKKDIPWDIGVYVPDEYRSLVSVSPCRRRNRKYPSSVMLLMMFRSSNRDKINFQIGINQVYEEIEFLKTYDENENGWGTTFSDGIYHMEQILINNHLSIF